MGAATVSGGKATRLSGFVIFLLLPYAVLLVCYAALPSHIHNNGVAVSFGLPTTAKGINNITYIKWAVRNL
jgi:hypothetical protein